MTLAFLIRDLSGDAGRLSARRASLVGHLILGMVGETLGARQAQKEMLQKETVKRETKSSHHSAQAALFAEDSWCSNRRMEGKKEDSVSGT
jgi:hypothetical protein